VKILFLFLALLAMGAGLTSCSVHENDRGLRAYQIQQRERAFIANGLAYSPQNVSAQQALAPVQQRPMRVPPPVPAVLASDARQVEASGSVAYQFKYGETALLKNGLAYAPENAPAAVKRAIEAGNRLQTLPYKWGGGHAVLNDTGYDCSGAVSYVLREAGLMEGQMPSKGFFHYGKRGEGKWITVYVRSGHVFMTVVRKLCFFSGGGWLQGTF